MFHELRPAARALRATPGQALGAVLVLALGLGATAAVYTLIDRVLLHPVDIRNADRVVRFFLTRPSGPPLEGFEYSEWLDARSQLESFDDIAAYGDPDIGPIVLDRGDRSIALSATAVSSNYFTLIGVPMARGAGFLADHDRPGAAPAAVLSDRAWRTLFDSATDVVGRGIHVNGALMTVVGVAPPGAHSAEVGRGPDLFVSLRSVPLLANEPGTFFDTEPVASYSPFAWLKLLGRLKRGVSIERAEAETELRRRTRLFVNGLVPEGVAHYVSFLQPLTRAALPVQTRREAASFLSLLGGTVGLLLILTCASVAALLLARIERRRRDLAVRSALGAAPRQLVRLALAEALLVACGGGCLSLLVSRTLLRTLSAFAIPGIETIGMLELEPDLRVSVFALGAALVTALACGLVPGWQSARTDVVTHLVARPGSTGRGRFSLQSALAAAQLAVALALLVGAALFVRCVESVLGRDLGFASQRVLIATPKLAPKQSPETVEPLLQDALARLRNRSGVEIAVLGPAPLGPGCGSPSILRDGQKARLPEGQRFCLDAVGGGYLTAIGVPVIAGREILEADQAGRPLVAVVNQSFARAFWPGEHVVGRRFKCLPFENEIEIIGLAQDARFRSLDSGPTPGIYMARNQAGPYRRNGIVIRTSGDPKRMAAAVKRELAEIWPRDFVPQVSTIDDLVAARLRPQRLAVLVLGWLGALAALVAVIGVSSLVASGVAQRTHEIGVRVALGATRLRVLSLAARRGLVPLAAGVVGGLTVAVLARNLIRAFLRDIGPVDFAAFAGAVALLLVATTLGVGVAAWRALRIDPAVALRAE
jgi:putative ABC transport system permease protein